jgi:hypothetical protein
MKQHVTAKQVTAILSAFLIVGQVTSGRAEKSDRAYGRDDYVCVYNPTVCVDRADRDYPNRYLRKGSSDPKRPNGGDRFWQKDYDDCCEQRPRNFRRGYKRYPYRYP